MTATNRIRDWQPSGPLVLAALVGGPRHGYAIGQTIHRITGITVGRGTLSSAFGWLQTAGLIERLPDQGRRRPYQLTPTGRTQLLGWADTTNRVVAHVHAHLDPPDNDVHGGAW